MFLRSLGPVELLIILAIVIMIFGVGKLSGVGGAMGKAIKEFRQTVRTGDEDTEEAKISELSKSAGAEVVEKKEEKVT